MRNQENVIDAMRLMEHPLCRVRTFAGAAGCLRGQALISVFPPRRRGRMYSFPTTAYESSTDKATMKRPMESDDKPKKHSVDGEDRERKLPLPMPGKDREQDDTAVMP